MALGTYDREERKKLAYNANGTTSEEKDDRSAQGNESRQESVVAPMQPTQVAPAPQVQNVGTVNVPQVNASAQPKQEQSNDELTQQNSGATPPQKVVTNQGSQSNVIPGGEIKNNQGEVNQETGTSSESQVGPESSAGGENYQWKSAPQGDVTSTYNNLIGPQNATPPLNAPVREFGGYNFSTVTPSGKALTDSDMDAYFDMLKRKSEETGASVEDLDKIAGNLLVGKIPSAEQSNQETAPAVESVPENGNITTNKGAANTTTDNGASSTSGTSSGKPKVTVMPPAAKPAASGTSAPASEEQQYYDGWKDFTVEQLKDMLPANSGIPAKKAALERLISEKGGSVTTPAQGAAAGVKGGNSDTDGSEYSSLPLDELEVLAANKKAVLEQQNLADDEKKKYEESLAKINKAIEEHKKPKDASGEKGGQPELDYFELQQAENGNDKLDPNYRTLRDSKDSAEKNYADRVAWWNDPENPRIKGAAAKKAEEEKAAGLDKESEERRRKRSRTSRLIANIGDILQGFANLAGTWYGAKSSELTSLSAAQGQAEKDADAIREKRRATIQKNYEDSMAKIYKEMDKDLSQYLAEVKSATDRYHKYMDNTAKENLRTKHRREEYEKETEEYNKRAATRFEYDSALKDQQIKGQLTVNAAKQAGQMKLKAMPPGKNPSSNRKKTGGKNKTGGGSKPASRR